MSSDESNCLDHAEVIDAFGGEDSPFRVDLRFRFRS